ncbi:hypothetical protein DTO271G3_5209 [Paecilomyces variotii]|nr:hypothetical protein DTO271G3_5209 [Paecilomyces variotii]
MSDTCIVCLGDLGESASDPLAVAAESTPRLEDGEHGAPGTARNNSKAPVAIDNEDEDSGWIAHLIPCGHNLHNNCLKPWVERANSCPICRQSFNVVELTDIIGGPVLSSYVVPDKVQVADIDPSMIIEEIDDEDDTQPCPICGYADNEEVLLLCDGCDVPIHTYCTGLDDVPSGSWYCEQCEMQRAVNSVADSPIRSLRARNRPERRTRAQQRRVRSRNQVNSLHWARVWQSVWDRLNLDLDFPFDDERAADRVIQQQRREAANQREFRAWQRRFQVAERQGGARSFRDTATLLDIDAPRPSRPRVPRAPTPEPESLEEMRAWNAFERARELENDPSASRKRKEPTLSPSPEPTEPQRKLKRPRTRRPEDLAALAMQNGESSRMAREQASARLNAETNTAGPSFLQSLLKEVEDSSRPDRSSSYGPSVHSSTAPTDLNTPALSSPSLSPVPSNRSSPHLTSSTPPPNLRARPISPIQLSSPVDVTSPSYADFSPSVSPTQGNTSDAVEIERSRPSARRLASSTVGRSSRPGTARSNENSPTRGGLSLEVKSDIQKLVGGALKPFYRRKVVSKDEYTDINRTISRMLYDRVGDVQSLDHDAKVKWEAIANHEVKKAIEALKQGKEKEKASSDNEPSS